MRPASLAPAVLLVVLGCRGGESRPPGTATSELVTPSTPVLDLELEAVKRFRFRWADVEHETEYRLLERSRGASGYAVVATLPEGTTNHDLEVFLPARIGASYVLEACHDADCTRSREVFVDGHLEGAIGYVKASNTGPGHEFGRSVALSSDGTTLAIGAWSEDGAATGIDGPQDDHSAPRSGAVYVFTRDDERGWSQQAYVKASNTGEGHYFGSFVALSADGSTLAVGAPVEASAAEGVDGDQSDDSAEHSGAVYVFTRDEAGAWSQQACLEALDNDAGDFFGNSVALSADGDTLAVGATGERSAATGIDGDPSDNSAFFSGAVYVFGRGGGVWSQQAYIKASNSMESDDFGCAVALSADGNTLAAGAFAEDSAATGVDGNQYDRSATTSGAVYVFTRSDGAWSQQAYLKASNTDALDRFGAALAMSDDGATLAVGAPFEDGGGTGVDGAQTDKSARLSGAVYVFTRRARAWSQQAYVKASNTSGEDRFGSFVALSGDGDTLAVAAPLEDGRAMDVTGNRSDNVAVDSGAVYLFTRSDSTWSQQALLKAPNADRRDQFGPIALSGDGSALAVGAPKEDSAATGLGGDLSDDSAEDAGAVYLY